MIAPESLRDIQGSVLISTLQPYLSIKKKNLNVSDPKSAFGKAVENILHRKSSIDERRYLHHLWQNENKENEHDRSEKHLRSKKYQREQKAKKHQLLLQAECSLLKKKFQEKALNYPASSASHPTRQEPQESNPSKRKGTSPHKSSGILKRLRKEVRKKAHKYFESLSSKSSSSTQNQQSLPSIHDSMPNANLISDKLDKTTSRFLQPEGTDESDNTDSEEDRNEVQLTPVVSKLLKEYTQRTNTFPTFVCPVCKRLLYNNKHSIKNYTFSQQIIQQLKNHGFDLYQHKQQLTICRRCYDNLQHNKIPAMAFFNKMDIERCPELEQLNDIEAKLISQIKLFMKIYYLSKGWGQRALKGSCIHFPQSVEEVVETLPLNRNSADILIINETSKTSSSSRQFEVRANLLYTTLQFLKKNNPLYANVKIREDFSNDELQINEIHQGENQFNKQTTHLLSKPATGYSLISKNSGIHILRASISQSSALLGGGNQSAAMCATAIAYCSIQCISTWSSSDFDNILLAGDQYFEQINPQRKQTINLSDLTGYICCYEKFQYQIQLNNETFDGYLNKVPGHPSTSLAAKLADFIGSCYTFSILHVNGSYLSVIKTCNEVFLFDPFSRGPKGRSSRNGTACIIKSTPEYAASYFSATIHSNCQPKHMFNINLSTEQKALFQFCLMPIQLVLKETPQQEQKSQTAKSRMPIGQKATKSKKATKKPSKVGPSRKEENANNDMFHKIDSNMEILRANFHQGSLNIFPRGGVQCAAMCASAAAHTLIKPVNEWNRDFLNKILLHGDPFYWFLIGQRNPNEDRGDHREFLEATEVRGPIRCTNSTDISVRVSLQMSWNGSLDMVPGLDVTRLSDAIQNFMEHDDYNNAILTLNLFSIGLLKYEGFLYIFNSHPTGPKGNRCGDGAASVIRFNTENNREASQIASQILHNLYAPTTLFDTNRPYGEQLAFIFTIRPIVCSLIKPAEPNVDGQDHLPDASILCPVVEKATQRCLAMEASQARAAVETSQDRKNREFTQDRILKETTQHPTPSEINRDPNNEACIHNSAVNDHIGSAAKETAQMTEEQESNCYARNNDEELDNSVEKNPLQKFDVPLHQNHLLLDCVIRADEPDQPTIKQFIQACKDNETAFPEVHLERQQGRPLYPGIERKLEELAFIKAFPLGVNGCNEERKIPITPLDYFQQRIMGVNGNFHSTEYLFYALSRVEAHVIQKKISVVGNMVGNNGNVQNDADIGILGIENPHLIMVSIRGSSSYWRVYTANVLSMIGQLGVPHLFLTLSYDDLNSDDAVTALWKAKYGPDAELPGKATDIDYEERKQLLNDFPAAAARHFNNRMNVILDLLKKHGEELFGRKVADFTYRVEFQGRGSAHTHMLIWLEDAPDWETQEGIEFLERNISCSLDVPYSDLVMRYQNHAHRSTCFKKHNICRFGFPRRPSETTRILDEEEIAKCHGRFVELRRTKREIMINNYHPVLLQLLKCNMDIQAVTGTRAIAYYIGKYMSKGEPAQMREEISNVINSFKEDRRGSYHRKAQQICNAIIKHREISAQEAAFRLLHLRLRNSSRSFVYVPTHQPENRVRLIRRDTLLTDEPKAGKNIIDRYQLRPDSLENLCLLEFAAWYTPRPNKNQEQVDEDLRDGEEAEGDEDELLEKKLIKLKNSQGYMCRRKRHAIVTYPRFKPSDQTNDYLYSMILLHLPFRDENILVRGFESLRDAFGELKKRFRTHQDDSIINPEQVEKIESVLQDIEQEPPSFRDPHNESIENYNVFEEDANQPLQEEELFVHPELDNAPDQPQGLSLTREQQEVFDKVSNQIHAQKRGTSQRVRLIVQGCAGTGKSTLIHALTRLITERCPGNKKALIKCAPTGIAGRGILGTTLHRAFSLGVEQHSVAQFMKLGGRLLHERQILFRDVLWILIDEYSMISYQVLRQINQRCMEILGNEYPFGNINIIILGDLLQLPPCRGNWIFDQPKYLSHEVHLWRLFDYVELQRVMRQRDDSWIQLLNRLRIGTLRREDVHKFRERLLNPLSNNYSEMLGHSKESLHLYPKCKQVEEYNDSRLQEMKDLGATVYTITAYDTYGSGLKFAERLAEGLVSKDIRQCAGIPTNLNLAVGSRVMLKWNINPLGGLCNGSLGTIRGFNWRGLRRQPIAEGEMPESVMIEFDGDIDPKYLSKIPGYENCCSIDGRTFEFNGKRGVRVHRKQLPIVLSHSCTVHKSQGLSLDTCTVYMGRHIFKQAMIYVAVSRVRTWDGLFIAEIDENRLLVNDKGAGPCCNKPLKELTTLALYKFLGEGGVELDAEMMDELIQWYMDYPRCKYCKQWECICICSLKTKK